MSTMPTVGDRKWRPVPGWESTHKVHPSGFFLIVRRNRVRKPRPNGRICISDGRGKQWSGIAGRLLLLTFVGPCPPGTECLHRDDDRMNNDISNLRWGTRSENIVDSYRNGKRDVLVKAGADNGNSKLTDPEVERLRKLRRDDSKKWTFKKLAGKFCISKSQAFNIVKERCWK